MVDVAVVNQVTLPKREKNRELTDVKIEWPFRERCRATSSKQRFIITASVIECANRAFRACCVHRYISTDGRNVGEISSRMPWRARMAAPFCPNGHCHGCLHVVGMTIASFGGEGI